MGEPVNAVGKAYAANRVGVNGPVDQQAPSRKGTYSKMIGTALLGGLKSVKCTGEYVDASDPAKVQPPSATTISMPKPKQQTEQLTLLAENDGKKELPSSQVSAKPDSGHLPKAALLSRLKNWLSNPANTPIYQQFLYDLRTISQQLNQLATEAVQFIMKLIDNAGRGMR